MDPRLPRLGDTKIDQLIGDFFAANEAGKAYLTLCEQRETSPIIDHITFRCNDIDRRADLFLKKGYCYEGEKVEYPDQGWWAKVYRKQGFPALFIDQAYDDARGQKSIIPQWVSHFGDDLLHHAAVLVKDIEKSIEAMRPIGVTFAGEVAGNRGTRLRQIFSAAEVRDGAPFTVLELTERNGYEGFYPEQANLLMASSVTTKGLPPCVP